MGRSCVFYLPNSQLETTPLCLNSAQDIAEIRSFYTVLFVFPKTDLNLKEYLALVQTLDPSWSHTSEAKCQGSILVSKFAHLPGSIKFFAEHEIQSTTVSLVFIMSSFPSVCNFSREPEISNVILRNSLLGRTLWTFLSRQCSYTWYISNINKPG